MSSEQDVLRGASFEAAPIRLPLARSPVGLPGARGDQPASLSLEEDAIRRGYEEGVRQGRAEGRSSGHAEGLREGRLEAETLAADAIARAVAEAERALLAEGARLAGLAGSIAREIHASVAVAEDEMVALCYDTVCRVLATHAVEPRVVRAQLAAMLAQAKAEPQATLRVHVQDLALVAEYATGGAASGQVRWEASDDVQLGGCVIVGRAGALDARLETMLDACRNVLLQERARRAAAGDTP